MVLFYLKICENCITGSEVEMREHKQHGDLISLPLFLWKESMQFCQNQSFQNVKVAGGTYQDTHTHTHTHTCTSWAKSKARPPPQTHTHT
jgi:hypothetical protein